MGIDVRTALTDPACDEDLLVRYRDSRDNAALEQLVRRHVPRVRSLILPMVLDDHLADDLTQETLLRAVRALDSFQGRSQFATWLCRIAMNVTHSFLARRARSPVVFHGELADRGGSWVTPERTVANAELWAQTEKAIGGLSPKLRAALVLTALQGLSPQQAAEIENCKEATMYWRVHEARKQLRHKLRDHLS